MQGSCTNFKQAALKLLYGVLNHAVNFGTGTGRSAAAQLSCKASKAAGNLFNHYASFHVERFKSLSETRSFTTSGAQVAQLQAQLSSKASEAAGLTRKLAAVDPLTDALEAELRALQQGLTKVTARVQGQEAGLKGHEKRLLEMVQVRCCCSVAKAAALLVSQIALRKIMGGLVRDHSVGPFLC
jgi:septal ring factor EnvC (AmiA/AmiB activator)